MINIEATQLASENTAKEFSAAWAQEPESDQAYAILERFKALRRDMPIIGGGDFRHFGYKQSYPLTQG